MPATPETTTADLSDMDATTALFQAAIGPINTAYYTRIFTRFDMFDRASASWNWAAALFTLSWLAYRQLWLAALGYVGAVVGVVLMVFGIGRLVFQFSEGVELGLLLGAAMAAFAVPGLYGNALLYAACRKKMGQALSTHDTLAESCAALTRQAPSRFRAILLALVQVAVLALAVAAYFEFPMVDHKSNATATQDGATQPALAASAPQSAASAPQAAASAPLSAASAPQAAASAVMVSPPAKAASAPAAAVTALPAVTTAPTPAVAASAPAPAPSLPTATAMPANAKLAAPVAVAPAAAKQAAASAPAASPKKAKASAAAKGASPKAASAQSFYVNVGLFADDNNALNAYVKLKDAGLPATRLEFNTSKGKRTRVRVGPYDTEGQVQSAVEKVRALGLDAIILRPK